MRAADWEADSCSADYLVADPGSRHIWLSKRWLQASLLCFDIIIQKMQRKMKLNNWGKDNFCMSSMDINFGTFRIDGINNSSHAFEKCTFPQATNFGWVSSFHSV